MHVYHCIWNIFIIASGAIIEAEITAVRNQLEFLVLFSSHIWLLVCSCRYKVTLWWTVYFSEPIAFHTFKIFGDFSKCLMQLLCLLLWSLIRLSYHIPSHAEPLNFPVCPLVPLPPFLSVFQESHWAEQHFTILSETFKANFILLQK